MKGGQPKGVKIAVECAFVQHCSSSSSRVIRQFVENGPVDNVEIGQIWPLMTSGDLTFDLT